VENHSCHARHILTEHPSTLPLHHECTLHNAQTCSNEIEPKSNIREYCYMIAARWQIAFEEEHNYVRGPYETLVNLFEADVNMVPVKDQ
jgi:hypothetical protein